MQFRPENGSNLYEKDVCPRFSLVPFFLFAAAALAHHEGELYLYGLTALSDAAAVALARHKGFLGLGGLSSLSDAAAAALAHHEGDLGLGGLTALSDAAATALAGHNGPLFIGLDQLPKSAAAILRPHVY
jgi:hypothetical protein